MKVWHFHHRHARHGPYIYREETPLAALQRRGHTVGGGWHPDQCETDDWDVFHFARGMQGDYPLEIEEIHDAGKVVVYDVDDAMDLLERHNPLYFDLKKQLPSYYYLLNEADCVTTTTHALAAHLRTRGARRVEVFPNCLDPTIWTRAQPRRRPLGPVRIGLVGWVAHLTDMVVALQALALLRRARQDFQIVLFGIATHATSAETWIAKCRTQLAKERADPDIRPNVWFETALDAFEAAYLPLADLIEWHSMVPMDDYPQVLHALDLDIGCCPLLDTPFNRMKSCVKFYEYAQVGAVTVASEVLPYSEEPVIPVGDDPIDWAEKLYELMRPDLRQALLLEQQVWVRAHRDVDRWAIQREALFTDLLAARQPAVAPCA